MTEIIKTENIQTRIFTIRNSQVMLDRDLAEIYGVETRRLNEQVRRNIERFPENFMFQLTKEEMENWKSQFAISNKVKMGVRKPPLAFTEQGVSMLSSVLNSKVAIEVSIRIINAFIDMRKFISHNANIFDRLSNVEQKQIETDIKLLNTNSKIDSVLNAIEDKSITPKQGIFYNGQIFDAYTLIADIIRTAKKSIILIDNYIDDTVFKQLAKRNKNVKATVFSKTTDKIAKQDLKKHNEQYPTIELKKLTTAHDRFLIIDNKTVYHFGASLKDAGKKWFAFSKLSIDASDIVSKL